jgi:hypothetical protein
MLVKPWSMVNTPSASVYPSRLPRSDSFDRRIFFHALLERLSIVRSGSQRETLDHVTVFNQYNLRRLPRVGGLHRRYIWREAA